MNELKINFRRGKEGQQDKTAENIHGISLASFRCLLWRIKKFIIVSSLSSETDIICWSVQAFLEN